MVTCRLGKPHPEQGQIGPAPLCRERPALVLLREQAGRVGCLSPAVTSGLEEWSSGRAQRSGRTGSGLQTGFGNFKRIRRDDGCKGRNASIASLWSGILYRERCVDVRTGHRRYYLGGRDRCLSNRLRALVDHLSASISEVRVTLMGHD